MPAKKLLKKIKTAVVHGPELKHKTMKTDLNYVKKLIKLLDSGEISELEIEKEGVRIKLVKNRGAEPAQYIQYAPQQNIPAQETKAEETKAGPSETKPVIKENTVEVRSPIVGTFYRAPSPNADPYVQVG